MAVLLLTLRDLQYRAVRLVVVSVLAGIVFALLFITTGLVEQLRHEPEALVDAVGGAAWVLPDGVDGPFTAVAAVPESLVAPLVADGGRPLVVGRALVDRPGADRERTIVIGADSEVLEVVDGEPAVAPGELTADRTAGWDVGERVSLGGLDFTVVGLTADTTLQAGTPVVAMGVSDARAVMFGSRPVTSAVIVEDPDPELPAGLDLRSPAEVADDAASPLDDAFRSIDLVRVLLWIIAAVVMGAVVYLSALERTRDFAVLKAVGASNVELAAGLALQAVVVATAAIVVALVLQPVIRPLFPLPLRVPASTYLSLPLQAVVLALVGGLAGMRRVAGSDPVDAFGGPT